MERGSVHRDSDLQNLLSTYGANGVKIVLCMHLYNTRSPFGIVNTACR